MTQGTEGRDTDEAGSPGILEEKEGTASVSGASGHGADTDVAGSTGIVNEATRPAQAGETGLTRFGAEGDDTDGAGSGGMVQKQDAGDGEGLGGTSGS